MTHRILDIRGLADLDDGRIDLPIFTDEKQIPEDTGGEEESKKKKKRKTRGQREPEQERNWSRARFGAEDFEAVPQPKN